MNIFFTAFTLGEKGEKAYKAFIVVHEITSHSKYSSNARNIVKDIDGQESQLKDLLQRIFFEKHDSLKNHYPFNTTIIYQETEVELVDDEESSFPNSVIGMPTIKIDEIDPAVSTLYTCVIDKTRIVEEIEVKMKEIFPEKRHLIQQFLPFETVAEAIRILN